MKGFWLLAAYWSVKVKQQKQAVNPLPKVNICALFDAIASKYPADKPDKVDIDMMRDVLSTFKDSVTDLVTHMLIWSDVGNFAVKKKRDANCGRDRDKSGWGGNGAFNGHAGWFKLKEGPGRDGIEIAIEARKADSTILPGAHKGYLGARFLFGKVTAANVVKMLKVAIGDLSIM